MSTRAGRRAARGTPALARLTAASILLASPGALAEGSPKGAHGESILDGLEIEPGATVVAIEDGDIVVDLGRDTGLSPGDAVELWRPLKLRHPVTGKTLNDRFRIGTLELVQVRPELSLARPRGDLDREPQPGDLVVFREKATPPMATPPSPGEPAPDPAPLPAETPLDVVYAMKMMEALRGATLSQRIQAYDDFVRRFPQSRLSPTFYEESAALRKLHQLSRSMNEEKSASQVDTGVRVVEFRAPDEARSGQPLTIGIELSDDAVGAVVHLRRPSTVAYASKPMQPMGNGYFAATIPAAEVIAPSLEFFIEATDRDGHPVAVASDENSPDRIDVIAPPGEEAKSEILATVALMTDYADYNRVRGDDRVWQTEGWFGMRLSDTGLRALRSGFGVYRGVGGSVEELDELGREPRKVGLTYGYVEAEAAPIEALGFIGRGMVGLGDDGVSGGGQFLVRIGHDQRTNLMLGGELLGQVGLRSIAQLELATFERFPIMLRTEVTNQPAGASPSSEDIEGGEDVAQGGGEIGARGIAQLGFRVVPELVIAARGSFQGRTIEHAGPGVGGAVSYSW